MKPIKKTLKQWLPGGGKTCHIEIASSLRLEGTALLPEDRSVFPSLSIIVSLGVQSVFTPASSFLFVSDLPITPVK